MSHFKEKFARYIDAGVPLIYLNTFEEDKADAMIRAIAGGRGIIEWNARMWTDSKAKTTTTDMPLAESLELLLGDLNSLKRKILVLKDVHFFLKCLHLLLA